MSQSCGHLAAGIARSAVVIGAARRGEGSMLAEGAVIRSDNVAVEISTGSAVLEKITSRLTQGAQSP